MPSHHPRFFLDTEFAEEGNTLTLISIGIAAEDGRTYYAENSHVNRAALSPWLWRNVVPQLSGDGLPPSIIAEQVREFCGVSPSFWAYYASYDWVVFCQLFGGMLRLPPRWPKFCMDLKQYMVAKRIPELPKQLSQEHHALNDAVWLRDSYRFVYEQKREEGT